MATLKQIEANRRNSQLSTGPTSSAGKAAIRMNALKTGIDAQSQIITGEDPDALERLTTQYYDRYQPQGPEEIALIDDAVSSDWLLRRLRKVEAEMWNRSTAEHAANLFKWGQKAEKYPLAAAFLDQQKALERLQRRISAAGAPPDPPATPSKETVISEIGFVPEISSATSPDLSDAAPLPAMAGVNPTAYVVSPNS